MTDRTILAIGGGDRVSFLQGLITNDVKKLVSGPVYTAILTPQGKLITDFFVAMEGDAVLIDVAEAHGDMLAQRLAMYKLRASVEISGTDLHMHRGLGEVPKDGYADPRNAGMGWRAYRPTPQHDDTVDWEAQRVALIIPETGVELTPDTFILEVGFERLNGVDFRKGCYVGQEVTARMKHKTELRKGLARVTLDSTAKPGSDILRDGKSIGTLHTVAGPQALAYLRFDKAGDGMTADGAGVALG
jgi:folate-binding protein YgfZ